MTGWNCYGSPVAALDDFDRAVYQVIKDARGFFRTRGMTADEIRAALPRALVAFRASELPPALDCLAESGLIVRTADGKWMLS